MKDIIRTREIYNIDYILDDNTQYTDTKVPECNSYTMVVQKKPPYSLEINAEIFKSKVS